MKFKILSLIAACGIFAVSQTYASEISSIHVDNDTQIVTVAGSLGAEYGGKRVLCQLLQKGKEPAALEGTSSGNIGSIIKGLYDCGTDSSGNYSVSFKMQGDSGTYWIVAGGGTDGNADQKSFDFYNPEDLNKILTGLESARLENNGEKIRNILDDTINRKMLSIEEISCSGIAYADLTSEDFDMLSKCDEPYSTAGAFVSQYGKLLVVKAFNAVEDAGAVNALITECDEYLKLLSEPAYELYTKFDSESAGYVNKKIVSAQFTSVSEIADLFNESVLLRGIYNMENYSQLSDYIHKYNDKYFKLDISGYTGNAAADKQLVGKEYASMSEFRKAFNDAVNGKSSESGSSSAGGSKPKSNTGTSSVSSGTVTPVITPVGFSDLSGYEWAKTAIVALAAKKIVSGVGNNCFAPERNITRREAAKILSLAFGFTESGSFEPFNDVDSTDWAYSYIATMRANNIITGDENNNFNPDNMITREELATIIYRSMIYKNMPIDSQESTLEFSDSDLISDYAREGVNALHRGNIISGMENGNFCPKDNCTRAQAVVMIYRVLYQ